MAVPAGERSAFEMVEAERRLQLPVVVLDAPPQLRQPDQVPARDVGGQVWYEPCPPARWTTS